MAFMPAQKQPGVLLTEAKTAARFLVWDAFVPFPHIFLLILLLRNKFSLKLGQFWVQCFLVFSVRNPKHRFISHTLLNLNLHFEEFYDSDQFTRSLQSHLFLKLKYNFENPPSRLPAQIRLSIQLTTSCITRHVAVVAGDKIAHVRRVANHLWCVKF